MPTRAAFIESNPDDYICNLIKTGLFLERTLKAWEVKRHVASSSQPGKKQQIKVGK